MHVPYSGYGESGQTLTIDNYGRHYIQQASAKVDNTIIIKKF